MRRSAGKGRMSILPVVVILVTLLVGWAFIVSGRGAADDAKLHVAKNMFQESQPKRTTTGSPIRITKPPKTTDTAEGIPESPLDYHTLTGDYGAEGHAATLISMPAREGGPISLGLINSERDSERSGFKILKNVLSRWGERTNKKLQTSSTIPTTGNIPPTVVIVGSCDPDDASVKKFIGCSNCDGNSLKSRLETVKEAATTGNLLLIPHNRISEGLLLMTYVFDFQLGDILHLVPSTTEKEGCPYISSLFMIAEEAFENRISNAVEFSLQLQGFEFAMKGLPNYCQGMYPFSQCQMMKEGWKHWDRTFPTASGKKYTCPNPDVDANSKEVVPDGGDAETVAIGQQLLDTAWPRCASKPAGCRPKHGIAFVKTHKTASSTLEGLLQRICVTRRLSCFTHSGKFFNYAYGEQAAHATRPHRTAPALTLPYEGFVAHTMNTPALLDELVPSSNGHMLTIIREASARYKSHWNFWVSQNQFVADGWPWKAGELDKMCEATSREDGKELVEKMNREPLNIRLALNNMARQLMGCTYCGTSEEMETRFQKLLTTIKEPNSKYHILISEKLHESLILFKRDYGLELADLVYASRNMGNYRKEMPAHEETCLKRINDLDTRLYETALEVHNKRVLELGQEFADEVKQLDRMVETLVKNSVCTPKGPWKCEKGSKSALCTQCLDILGQGKDPTGTLIDHFSKCKPN
eukprot:TRINITY_DN1498_c0_g4_i1.p1 TRINITY_DN1498_c0_g4~~TRINITY_DN1498_c0_g4_i1.p1  ORF type:complete len:698 (+),score=112.54 TRINITY_DN1498_c0_g4_i1:53-2146(+)